MRTLYILFAFVGIIAWAQEPGKAGELLVNEIELEKISGANDRQERGRYEEMRNYRWNYTTGNSEVFIRIPERGRFTIEVGDQTISNANGRFRFFDLRQGNTPISIYHNNFLCYRTRIDIMPNSRIVLDFFSDYGLYLLEVYPLGPNPYGVNEWDDIWNDPYDGVWYPEPLPHATMNEMDFNRFMMVLEEESFDKGKKKLIQRTARTVYFNANQIKQMLELFSFDDNKLEAAIGLYSRCVDKYNYHIVDNVFSFESNRRKLHEYILRH